MELPTFISETEIREESEKDDASSVGVSPKENAFRFFFYENLEQSFKFVKGKSLYKCYFLS